jgi:hypothetical protein
LRHCKTPLTAYYGPVTDSLTFGETGSLGSV